MRFRGTGRGGWLLAGALAGCAATGADAPPSGGPPAEYLGIQTRLLDGDLVNFLVSMRNPPSREAVAVYAECAASQYALIRGYGFARHLRTNVAEEGGVWRGDAVYTISSVLPDGVRTLDAEVVVQNCREQGIPTV